MFKFETLLSLLFVFSVSPLITERVSNLEKPFPFVLRKKYRIAKFWIFVKVQTTDWEVRK